jgi:hypothetical protein
MASVSCVWSAERTESLISIRYKRQPVYVKCQGYTAKPYAKIYVKPKGGRRIRNIMVSINHSAVSSRVTP